MCTWECGFFLGGGGIRWWKWRGTPENQQVCDGAPMSIVMMVGDSAAVVAAGGVFLDSVPVQAPVSSSGSSDYGTPGPEVAILFVFISLCLGVLSRQLLRGTRVPYTVALLLLGIGLGSLGLCTRPRMFSLLHKLFLLSPRQTHTRREREREREFPSPDEGQ